MPLNEKSKKTLNFFLRIGLTLILLGYLYHKVDIEKTKEVLLASKMIFIWQAALLFVVINGLLLVRWFVFIKALDLEVRALSVVRYFFVGLFGNLFLPSSMGGDFMRILGLCKETHHKTRVVASVLLDRLSGFVAIVLIAIGALILGYRHIDEKSLVTPVIALGVVFSLFIAVLFSEKVFSFGCRIFDKIPKVKANLMKMHYDIALLKNRKRQAVEALFLSCVSQLLFCLCFCLVARGMHQNTPVIYFLIFVPLICVISSLPSIGGLGVREAGAAYLFSRVGMDPGIAVSISLINFLFMVIIGLIGGLIYVVTFSPGRVQHHS
ncbi:MAG: flippase-like domain-containing protein [Candidatus Omnitrophica bacterium]|nr:flippase-like domain-containing protein [Candidatus Omnitrophota bacterium]